MKRLKKRPAAAQGACSERPAAAQRIKVLKKRPAVAQGACSAAPTFKRPAAPQGAYLRVNLKNEKGKQFMQIQLLTKDRNHQSVLCVRNTDLNVALADAKRIIATIDPEDVNVKINVKRAWDAEHSSDF